MLTPTIAWEINLGHVLTAVGFLLTVWKMVQGWRVGLEAKIEELANRIEHVHIKAIEEVRDVAEKVARLEGVVSRNGLR